MSLVVHTVSSESQLPPDILRILLESSSQPLVVKGQLTPWLSSKCWRATEICDTLKSTPLTTFKIFPRRGTPAYETQTGGAKKVIFETDCIYVKAYLTDFKEWLLEQQKGKLDPLEKKIKLDSTLDTVEEKLDDGTKPCSASRLNPLLAFPGSEYWVYADYKYLCNLCQDMPDFLKSVDWGVLGFKGRDGTDSTLWIGSEGACTPCHYDAYGFNIVAQLSGEKKWILFDPSEGESMYPTRVPYEESSIFSRVDVLEPDFVEFPQHRAATPYQVTVQEGDILLVPKHWWHYVETVGPEPSVSINTWVELPSDKRDRIEEALVRTLVTAFVTDDDDLALEILNPNEELLTNNANIHFLFLAIEEYKKSLKSSDTPQKTLSEALNLEDGSELLKLFLRILTDSSVLKAMIGALERH